MKGLDDLKGQPVEEAEESVPSDKLEPTPGIDVRDLDMLAVGRALGMNNIEQVKKNELRVSYLIDWAKSKGANDQLGLVAEIKGLIHRLGSPSIHDLYVYTRLDTRKTETEDKMGKMEV